MLSLSNEISKLIKKYRPTRNELEHALRECRRNPEIKNILGPVMQKKRKLPKLPPMDDIKKFMDVMEKDGNIKFRLMIKMLLYSGVRNSELLHIKISDINLSENRIFIENGKGGKNRYMIIFRDFRDLLVMYMNSITRNVYLFENKHKKRFSERWLRKVCQNYCKAAKLPRIHPHILRHVFITYLTKMGWSENQIMLLTGHTSKESLKIYQHLALPDIEEKFNRDMKEFGI